MEHPKNPPSKIARFAQHVIGPRSCDTNSKKKTNIDSIGEEGSSPTGLRRLGQHGRGSGHELISSKCSVGFTIHQLQELEQQALIYMYMEAGLPVPYQLIFPIWKSVATSFNGLNQVMGCSSLYCEYTNSMDPEPRRCKRTDGKKWRCSNDVIPDHKYCDRHIHRGRQRKHVQTFQLSNGRRNTTNLDIPNSDTGLSISLSNPQ